MSYVAVHVPTDLIASGPTERDAFVALVEEATHLFGGVRPEDEVLLIRCGAV